MKKLLVTGIVQGVGFRPQVYRLAGQFGLKGYVKNLGDAGVEIVVSGQEAAIADFTRAISERKVKNARIDAITELPPGNEQGAAFDDFRIMESGGSGAPGTIPPDHAMCESCLEEVFDPGDERRYSYAFTSCTDCGSRLSTIHALPYDRANTSLAQFPMCEDCGREYEDPGDRRLHFQGNTCGRCGPRYALHDGSGKELPFEAQRQVVAETVRLLAQNKVIAIKGVTGTHLAFRAGSAPTLQRLREAFGRPQKPFAVMAPGVDAIKAFAVISAAEQEALLSSARPIVLLEKKAGGLPDTISPGLANVGVMLPHAGIHHLIFEKFKEPLVMTSANFPAQPMLTRNNEILRRLEGVADFFLLHDLEVRTRVDDSVMRFAGPAPLFIRRSRGYAPSRIGLPFENSRTLLCLGSETNNTIALIRKGEATISQYVGDTSNLETLACMDRAVRTLLDMTGTSFSDIDAVGVDMNPAFDIRAYAKKLSCSLSLPVRSIQHHMAHAASLMGEHGVRDMVCIAVDGIGYGEDGKIWGGEIITAGNGGLRRTGHLKEQRMPGGDAATIFPARMLAGILFDAMGTGARDVLLRVKHLFRHGESEINVVLRQLEADLNVVRTTSCGRVLDALAALLGICGRRTYDGEPAMKLEAACAEPSFDIPVEISGSVLNTTRIVVEAARLLDRGADPGGIGASCQQAIALGLATIAVDKAKAAGIEAVGLTGGVAYNKMIHLAVREHVEKAGLRFVTNSAVSCGDGGISFGQGVYMIINAL
ncbi:MAG: carbamoyltransferase HypF [Pseudomonadota bacterium]